MKKSSKKPSRVLRMEITLTVSEKFVICQKAKRSGLTACAYMRQMVIKGEIEGAIHC